MENDKLYIVMENCELGDLGNILNKYKDNNS